MITEKVIGWLFIAGALGVFIPYTLLTLTFEYPDILRQETGVILSRFQKGGSTLIATWFAFALLGIPLLPAYILLGKKLEYQSSIARVATTLGVIGLVVQIIGLLRWTFVIPVLAQAYVSATDANTKVVAIMSFKTIHQFAGVLLGEHLGQLFTIIWTVLIALTLVKLKWINKWLAWLGYTSAFIYLLAQAELIATVIPDFPVWSMAGFIGSTLWLVWIIILGIKILRWTPAEL